MHETIHIHECGDGVLLAPDDDLTLSYYSDEGLHPATPDFPWHDRARGDCRHLLAGLGADWCLGPKDHTDVAGARAAIATRQGLVRTDVPLPSHVEPHRVMRHRGGQEARA